MAVNTTPITDAADELANSLTEGAQAVDELAQGIVNALVELDKRLAAVEEGGGTTPPVEPPIEPPTGETGTIPITFNDPSFIGMTEKTSKLQLSSGQNLSKTSIKEQSGDPSIVCLGNNKVTTCRVQSRECVRITSGNLTLDGCYFESKGVGDDHADTLQAYAPNARGGTITIKNTHIRAFASQSVGYFTADSWAGTIIHNNVIYQSGSYGLRTISDPGCHIDVDLENVFFVGPFTYNKFLFQEIGGGTLTIRKWINVRDATIQNGKLVPGNPINKPSADEMAAMAAKAPPHPKTKKYPPED